MNGKVSNLTSGVEKGFQEIIAVTKTIEEVASIAEESSSASQEASSAIEEQSAAAQQMAGIAKDTNLRGQIITVVDLRKHLAPRK